MVAGLSRCMVHVVRTSLVTCLCQLASSGHSSWMAKCTQYQWQQQKAACWPARIAVVECWLYVHRLTYSFNIAVQVVSVISNTISDTAYCSIREWLRISRFEFQFVNLWMCGIFCCYCENTQLKPPLQLRLMGNKMDKTPMLIVRSEAELESCTFFMFVSGNNFLKYVNSEVMWSCITYAVCLSLWELRQRMTDINLLPHSQYCSYYLHQHSPCSLCHVVLCYIAQLTWPWFSCNIVMTWSFTLSRFVCYKIYVHVLWVANKWNGFILSVLTSTNIVLAQQCLFKITSSHRVCYAL